MDHLPNSRAFFLYLERPSRRRLTAVAREYYSSLYKLASRVTRNSDDAADICQDVFLSLLLDPPEATRVRSPQGYLAARVLTFARRRRQSAVRRRARESHAATRIAATEGLPEDDLHILYEEIDKLPQRLRNVLELRYLGELRNKEIGKALGVSERAVERDLKEARDILRTRLGATLTALLSAWAAPGLGAATANTTVPSDLQKVIETGKCLRFPPRFSRPRRLSRIAATLIGFGLVATSVWFWFRYPETSSKTSAMDTFESPAEPRKAELAASGTPPIKIESNDAIDEVPSKKVVVRVSGWTIDEYGEPIEGVTVTVLRAPNFAYEHEDIGEIGATESREDGSFVLQISVTDQAQLSFRSRRGALSLVGRKPGFATGWAREFIDRAPATSLIEAERLQMVLTRQTAALNGSVVDPRGNGIAGATVRALPRADRLGMPVRFDQLALSAGVSTTDEDGSFDILDLGASELFDLIIAHPEHLLQRVRHVVPGGLATEYVLEPAVPVEGTVVDHQGNPVGDALVGFSRIIEQRVELIRADRRNVRTEANGSFRCPLGEGRYEMSVEAPDQYPSPPRSIIDAGEIAAPIKIVLPRGARVQGTVVTPSGVGIGAAVVLVSGDWGSRRVATGVNGKFRCEVAEGPVTVAATLHQGWRALRESHVTGDATVEGPLNCEFVFERHADETASSPSTVELRGQVLDSEGRPIIALVALRNARAKGFHNSRRETRTDMDGRFSMQLVGGTRLPAALDVAALGKQLYAAVTLSEFPSEDMRIVVHHYPSARVEGVVKMSDGSLVKRASIVVSRNMENMFRGVGTFVADDQGEFVLNGLLPHTYYGLTPLVDGSYGAYTTVKAEPGETKAVEIIVHEPNAVLEGRVTTSSEGPISGLRVTYDHKQDELPTHQVLFTREDGTFRAEGVLPGRYRVVVDNPGFSLVAFDVSTDEPPQTVTLVPTHTVGVRVVDPSGSPVQSIHMRGADQATRSRNKWAVDGLFELHIPKTETTVFIRAQDAEANTEVAVTLESLIGQASDVKTVVLGDEARTE